MTRVIFTVCQRKLIGYTIDGHTGSAAAGEDIVCAAISSAAYMAANTITDIIGVEADIEVEDGYMSLSLALCDADRCADILKGLELHLASLAQQYPDYIEVNTEVLYNAEN